MCGSRCIEHSPIVRIGSPGQFAASVNSASRVSARANLDAAFKMAREKQ